MSSMKAQSMVRASAFRKCILASSLLAGLLLGACSGSDNQSQLIVTDNTASMTLVPPAALISSRNVELDNLFLRVTIAGDTFLLQADDDGQYILRTELPPNTQTEVSLVWFEQIGNFELVLATSEPKPLNVGSSTATPALLLFSSDDYITSIDNDDDGISNLDRANKRHQFQQLQ